MSRATSEDKEVPDSMMVGKPAPGIKNHTHTVGNSAHKEQDQASRFDRFPHFGECNEAEPAHQQIRGCGSFGKFAYKKDLEDNPQQRHAPDYSKEAPAPSAA